jgi:hypothetical protein
MSAGPQSSSGAAGGVRGSSKARRPSSAGAAAAADHKWCQPPSLWQLRLDVAALREALDKGAGEAYLLQQLREYTCHLQLRPLESSSTNTDQQPSCVM